MTATEVVTEWLVVIEALKHLSKHLIILLDRILYDHSYWSTVRNPQGIIDDSFKRLCCAQQHTRIKKCILINDCKNFHKHLNAFNDGEKSSKYTLNCQNSLLLKEPRKTGVIF